MFALNVKTLQCNLFTLLLYTVVFLESVGRSFVDGALQLNTNIWRMVTAQEYTSALKLCGWPKDTSGAMKPELMLLPAVASKRGTTTK